MEALEVVGILSWWFGYSGPNHMTCSACNARIEIKVDGSYFHACGEGYGGFVVYGVPWEPFDPLDASTWRR